MEINFGNLLKAMNDEDTRTKPITIVENDNILGEREAANQLIDNYEEVSDLTIPEDRKKEVHAEARDHHTPEDQEGCLNKLLNMREFEEALNTLKEKKSPGPDKVTNEMLQHLGKRAKTKLLAIFNNSWTTGHVP